MTYGTETMNCKLCQAALPNLLLDPAAPANAAAPRPHRRLPRLRAATRHLRGHPRPARHLAGPRRLALLRPETGGPPPRASVRPPAGCFERLRTRLLFNTGRQFRPALAGATGPCARHRWRQLRHRHLPAPRARSRRPRPSTTSSSSTRTSRRCNRWTSSCRTDAPRADTSAAIYLRSSRMFASWKI